VPLNVIESTYRTCSFSDQILRVDAEATRNGIAREHRSGRARTWARERMGTQRRHLLAQAGWQQLQSVHHQVVRSGVCGWCYLLDGLAVLPSASQVHHPSRHLRGTTQACTVSLSTTRTDYLRQLPCHGFPGLIRSACYSKTNI
jgi:hypothetical protein